MIQHLLETDVTGMKTLDMGCGTAILAILAEMKAPNQLMPLTLTIGVEFNRKWNVTIVIKLLFEGDAIVKGQKV
jgi:ubiquinone/menaquinone biosynthesis C-methylase UbiE